MTQEQKQEFTRRISQENHTGLILVLCDIFHTYGNDAIAAYEADDKTAYLQNIGQARRAMQELIECFSKEDPLGRNVIAICDLSMGSLCDRKYADSRMNWIDVCRWSMTYVSDLYIYTNLTTRAL